MDMRRVSQLSSSESPGFFPWFGHQVGGKGLPILPYPDLGHGSRDKATCSG